MARVKKKIKKENSGDSKLGIILGSIAGVLALGCLIAFLVVFISDNMVSKLYNNSRDMDYDTLLEMYEDRDVRGKYEGTIYVLVFHSDIEQYEDYALTDSTNTKVKTAIKNDLALNEYYDNQSVENSNRKAFYAIDLMDSDNEGLVDDEIFGYSTSTDKNVSYLLIITNTSSGLTVSKKSASSSQVEAINVILAAEIKKYE